MPNGGLTDHGCEAIGVAWYRKDQWDDLLKVSGGRDKLEETYGEWLIEARMTVDRLRSQGTDVGQVDVDVGELMRWCKERGLRINAATRARYVADKLCDEHLSVG